MSQLKLVRFTKNRVDLWLIMAEDEFIIFGIVDDKVKYLTVFKVLDQDIIELMLDVVRQEKSTKLSKTR